MSSKVLFASVDYDRYDADMTLPAKFKRMIDKMELADKVKDKSTVIKMHVGRGIGFTTIHPLFVKILVDKLKEYGAKPFIADQSVDGARVRGYTEEFLGCPIVDVCGLLGKYYYPRKVDFKKLQHVDVAGHIQDADFMIDLSHVKGHGACGYGGACKNIAMGCVTDRTRSQIHNCEGGIIWNKELCTHCEQCVKSCNHNANKFNGEEYNVFFHHCTFCQHCVKVCPTGALVMDNDAYNDFQAAMAIATKEVIDTFEKDSVYYINFLTNITALCDCWGLSTPALVPDIGVMSSWDMVAVEKASIDAIKIENLLQNGVPKSVELKSEGHLFERLHAKDPYVQLAELEKVGLGNSDYVLEACN